MGARQVKFDGRSVDEILDNYAITLLKTDAKIAAYTDSFF